MKLILALAVLVSSLLFAPQLPAALPVSVTLALPHNDVLPGVPFDLVVTYTNVSDRPVVIDAAGATLVVTFADGHTVVLQEPERNDQWTIRGSRPVQLQPGQSVQHAASWENGSIPNWFSHGASFSGPGTYEIALDLRIYDKQQALGSIRTPAVRLHRIEPVGIDAELWKRMQEVSGGRWSDTWFKTKKEGEALAKEIVQIHPASGYYPYVLALRSFDRGVRNTENIPALLEAAERFPNSPAYPYLLTAAANCARYAGLVAADKGDIVEAKKYLALAETKYREALATKTSVTIRASSDLSLYNVARGMEKVTKKQPR